MIASGRTASASSGMISGVGLAMAKIKGSRAIFFTISGVSTLPADRPRKMSASWMISFSELDVEYVDPGKLLEQARLTLHDRLARQRADVAKAKNGGAVGDDRHEVAARRQLIGQQRIRGDGQARLCYAG